MADSQPTQTTAPETAYGLFAGSLDQYAIQRFHNALSQATFSGVKHIHLLFQCNGGVVGDGISLYNLLRAAPVDITLYNVGSISSIGTVAYLGAKHRKVSQYATFMIHRAYISPAGAGSERLAAAADQIILEDDRIEAILKAHTKIPADKWQTHKFADVWFSAKDSVDYGVADAIAEFSPPMGAKLFNVWPPQT